MKTSFKIELLTFSNINHLPEAWSQNDYRQLLELMDYGDTATILPDDLKEMCLLSITDYQPEEAASIVLEYVFKDRLNSGQIQNLSHEMQEEKMWEEYADISMHEEFFNIGQLLYEAYNGKFPHPEAITFKVCIDSEKENDLQCFDSNEIENTLLQLLIQGLPENTLINRLFKDELENGNLEQAKDIIWQFKMLEGRGNSIEFEIISSAYWLQDMKYVETFDAILFHELEKTNQ